MVSYENDLYFCDFGKDILYKIDRNGVSDPNTPIKVKLSFDDKDVLDGCSDVHFYKGEFY